MTNRPDLIEQLSKLTPTEGEWICSDPFTVSNHKFIIAETHDMCDTVIITLAPTMRLEILAMAKEIEFLNERIEGLKRQLTNGSPF